MAVNEFLEKRSFAGQVARAGESGIVTVSYVNQDTVPIAGGLFVARADDGCKKIAAASDMILGVSVVIGIHHEFEPGKNLSVFKIPHGSEIWVQMTDDSTLAEGDAVKIVASGDDAGKISQNGTIETPFYVTGTNGALAKVMRNEVVMSTATSGGQDS